MVIKKDNSAAKKALIGAGIVAGAALAAYLLTTPKQRKEAVAKAKVWMKDMKKETAARVKVAGELSREKYNEIVDELKPKYEALKDVSAGEVLAFTKDLKSQWENMMAGAKKFRAAKKKKK